jgi:hypothetical protein
VTENSDYITLKLGTLKSWNLSSDRARELFTKYREIGSSLSAMLQEDTPEQKELICQMIDACNSELIYLDWDGKYVSKEEAKKYVRDYRAR